MADFRTRGSEVLIGGAGLELVAFSFRTNAALAPDRVRDGGCNLIASITRSSAGKFSVTFNKPYPRQLVAGLADLHSAAANLASVRVNVPRDGYDNATGTFTIEVVTTDATPAFDELTDDDVISVIAVFQTVNVLTQP